MACLEQVLIHGVRAGGGARAMDARVERAARLLADHPARPLDLEALAGEVSLSASRLAHLFREQVGLSPLQVLERQRVEMARRLLSASGMSVKEVAAACGYASPFYFSLRFKRATGKSPSAYRER